jgi:hypothetical protein
MFQIKVGDTFPWLSLLNPGGAVPCRDTDITISGMAKPSEPGFLAKSTRIGFWRFCLSHY